MKIPTRLLNVYRLADTLERMPNRYGLHGCLTTRDSCGRCRIVAADGTVLVISEWDDDADCEPINVIVDRDDCRHAAEYYDDDSTLRCDPSKSRITLSDGHKTISSPPVQGKYPNVNCIVEQSSEASASVDARKLKQVVDTIVAMSDNERCDKIEVAISIHANIISITRPGTYAAVSTLDCSPKDKYHWRPEIPDLRTEELLSQWQAAVAKMEGGNQ